MQKWISRGRRYYIVKEDYINNIKLFSVLRFIGRTMFHRIPLGVLLSKCGQTSVVLSTKLYH